MRLSSSYLLSSIPALSGVVAVSGLERRCIATVRVAAKPANWVDLDVWLPSPSVEFEVEGKGTARNSPFKARKNARKGIKKCLKNYFEFYTGTSVMKNCNSNDECEEHVNPVNDEPLEDLIIKNLFVDKMGCSSGEDGGCYYKGGNHRWQGDVIFEIVSGRSPDGGSGCKMGSEDVDTIDEKFCEHSPFTGTRYSANDRCSDKLQDWCLGKSWN